MTNTAATLISIDKHKIAEYRRLGFSEHEADQLLVASVPLGSNKFRPLDVGTVRELLKQGCSVRLAYRIFRS